MTEASPPSSWLQNGACAGAPFTSSPCGNRTTWQPAGENERETPKVSWFLMKNVVGFGFRLFKFYSDVVGICHLVSIPCSQNFGSNIQPPPDSHMLQEKPTFSSNPEIWASYQQNPPHWLLPEINMGLKLVQLVWSPRTFVELLGK